MFECQFCKTHRKTHPGKVADNGWFLTHGGWICGACASAAAWGLKLTRT